MFFLSPLSGPPWTQLGQLTMNDICGGHWDTNEFLHQHHTWHRTRQTQTFSAWLWLIERSKPNWLVVDLPLWKIWVRQLGLLFPTEWTVINSMVPNHQPANSKWLDGYSWRQLNNRRWHHWFTSPAYDVVLPVWIRRIFTINKEPQPAAAPPGVNWKIVELLPNDRTLAIISISLYIYLYIYIIYLLYFTSFFIIFTQIITEKHRHRQSHWTWYKIWINLGKL